MKRDIYQLRSDGAVPLSPRWDALAALPSGREVTIDGQRFAAQTISQMKGALSGAEEASNGSFRADVTPAALVSGVGADRVLWVFSQARRETFNRGAFNNGAWGWSGEYIPLTAPDPAAAEQAAQAAAAKAAADKQAAQAAADADYARQLELARREGELRKARGETPTAAPAPTPPPQAAVAPYGPQARGQDGQWWVWWPPGSPQGSYQPTGQRWQ